MPDIFQAHDRDSDQPSTHYEVMRQQGSFWYYYASYDTRDEAEAAALLVHKEYGEGTLIDRVIREPIMKLQAEPLLKGK